MSETGLSRRRLLSGGLALGAAALAGCTESEDGGAGETAEEALRLTLSRDDGPLRESFVVDLATSDPEWSEAAFAATLDGEAYTTQYRKPFFSTPDDPTYTEHEGIYYRLGSVVVGEETVARPVLRLFEVADGETPASAAVAADRLPDVDSRAVRIAHLGARARGNTGGAPWGLVQRGGYVYRREFSAGDVPEDPGGQSELLADDGPDYVTYRERTYEADISRETFHEPVYRATVEPVADSPERMEEILRAQFVGARFDREGLSADAREVVEAARADGYRETYPYSEGYREVLRTLNRRAFVDGDIESDAGVLADERRMVRYDGVYYDLRLRFVPAAES